jgi:hypothetical protein
VKMARYAAARSVADSSEGAEVVAREA